MPATSLWSDSSPRRIGVDFDDVLHDFNNSFHNYHNKKYGTSVKRADIKEYDIEKVWGVTREEAILKVFEFYNSIEHEQSPPLNGAVDTISSLSKNYSLHIITSRIEEVDAITRRWLKRNFVPNIFDSIQFANHYGASSGTKRPKSSICNQLSIDIMIEDSLEHARAISACNIAVLLLDCPWNQGPLPPGVHRVYSWREIGDILLP